MKKAFYTFVLFLLIFLNSKAENKVIHGVVHTFDSIPLIGAEIKVKSSGLSYYTNTQGEFFVECRFNDRLKIKAKGFAGKNIRVAKNLKFLAVNLQPKSGNSSRLLEIGYGSMKESDKSTAVSNISHPDTDFSKYLNAYDLIRDNFAGVQVVNNEIIVRGTNSFLSSNAALIIIDGMISDGDFLNTISPLEIKEVNVIKDGSSAVYGSRGANGVVLIETKKGGEL